MGDNPDGIYARIAISDLTLEEAYNQVEDPSFWDETMPEILANYCVGNYWQLRVHEHGRLWNRLIEKGLVDAST